MAGVPLGPPLAFHDVLNIGGFSDAVFEVLGAFAADRLDPEHWVGVIDAIAI